jgi:hypothetical protein
MLVTFFRWYPINVLCTSFSTATQFVVEGRFPHLFYDGEHAHWY